MRRRQVLEPGGVLLVGIGLTEPELARLTAEMYPTYPSLTVLVSAAQQSHGFDADEIWVIDRLGLRGFLALIRRISWRHFDLVIDATAGQAWWLKYLIWPRPPYVSMAPAAPFPVDLHKY